MAELSQRIEDAYEELETSLVMKYEALQTRHENAFNKTRSISSNFCNNVQNCLLKLNIYYCLH